MSYLDKKFGQVLPTRHGVQTGHGNERMMLDRVGGSAGYRKDFLTEADGSVTMLTTKNGNPQFTRQQDSGYAGTTTTLYMETGQLEWSYPGELNPTRFDPAKWHFLDISPSDDYLGKVSVAGVQSNTPALTEGQDSIAIGTTPENKDAYGGATVMKKLAAAYFPASLFSGKMRLFMQALYGAKEKLASTLELGFVGTSPVLHYNDTESRLKLQFGFWPHGTPGIFTATDGSYWILDITDDASGFVVRSYPLRASGLDDLMARIALLSGDEKEKAEAYLFANSTVDVSKGVIVGTYPAVAGRTIAYGWKFNDSGTEARIVLNQGINSGATTRFYSRTVTLTFDGDVGGVTMAGSTVNNGEWIDGWGTYNIFAPDTETVTAPLSLFSIRVGSPPNGDMFAFSDIEVYGYYTGDTWTSIKLSYSIDAVGSYTQTNNAIFATPASALIPNNYQYSYDAANMPLAYSSEEIYNANHMTLSIGGSSYGGAMNNGVFITLTTSPTGGSNIDNPVAFMPNEVYDGSHSAKPTAPGYFYSGGGGANGGGWLEYGTMTRVYYEFRGIRYNAWALVIPGGDCCAAYAATRQSDGVGTYTMTTVTGPSIVRCYDIGGSFVPWLDSGHWGGWFGLSTPTVSVTTTPSPPAASSSIYCFNTAITGATGTAGGSLTGLFDCAYTYQYYDRGMYTYTSNGLRYVMSEGLKHPSTAYNDHRFVGWA